MKVTLPKAQILRLKALGSGLKIGTVLGNRVIVKPIKPYTDLDRVEKEGKLIIPEKVREDNTPLASSGIVIALGNGVEGFNRCLLAEGTMVMFNKFSGSEFTVDEVDIRVLDVDQILAVLEDTQNAVVTYQE